jgi:hypothetical protein
VQGENKELWLELCEQAAIEQDQDKFLVVVREIIAALELKSGRLHQSGPQLVQPASEITRCALCDKPVPLDISKTDERGKAVHEECYLLKMRLKRATSKDDRVHP